MDQTDIEAYISEQDAARTWLNLNHTLSPIRASQSQMREASLAILEGPRDSHFDCHFFFWSFAACFSRRTCASLAFLHDTHSFPAVNVLSVWIVQNQKWTPTQPLFAVFLQSGL
jgi:hypothetical protein